MCQRAAKKLGFPVPCPTLAPAPASSLQDCPCSSLGAFVMEGTFRGPLGYVGVGGEPSGHLWFLASPEGNRRHEYLICLGTKERDRVRLRGQIGSWLSCSEGSGMNSGHVLLKWNKGVDYAVSLHGHTRLNRELTLVLAHHLRFVG